LYGLQEAGKFKALLFTDKPKTPLMWRGVSVDLKGKMTMGVVQVFCIFVCLVLKTQMAK
jgi:hypothetical protein